MSLHRRRKLGSLVWPLMLATSAAAHACAFAATGPGATGEPRQRPPSLVDFDVVGPPPFVPEPESTPPAPPPPPIPTPPPPHRETAPRTSEAPRPTTKAPGPPPDVPSSEAPPPAAPLPGTTLAADGQDGTWSSLVGDGRSVDGPIGPVSSRPAAPVSPAPTASAAGAATPRPQPPAVVAVANLSRKPRAPDLNGALRANYPADARAAGIAGHAVVRAEIGPNGSVRSVEIASESRAGFGAACRATLLGSRWSAPLDQDGHPVATRVRYRCSFEVNR